MKMIFTAPLGAVKPLGIPIGPHPPVGIMSQLNNFTPIPTLPLENNPLIAIVSPNSSRQGWCNPLQIGFTTAARTADWTKRGFSWGLRMYKEGTDWGLTFKIKLQKEIPNKYKASIGPNPQLHHPIFPQTILNFQVPAPLFLPQGMLFQPSLPAGAPLFH